MHVVFARLTKAIQLDQLVPLKFLIYDSEIVEFLPLAETTGQVKTRELYGSHPLSCKGRSKYAGREGIKQRCTLKGGVEKSCSLHPDRGREGGRGEGREGEG